MGRMAHPDPRSLVLGHRTQGDLASTTGFLPALWLWAAS